MPKGFVYILECSDGTYYTGSTLDYEKRLAEHQDGKGANHTKKRLPVNLVYLEEYQRIDDAFNREKQIQGWGRKKKEALIIENHKALKKLAECKNESHHKNVASTPLSHQKMTPLSHQKTTPIKNKEANTLEAERSRSRTYDNQNSKSFKSNGKLLLTAEYLVLDSAKSLALPTTYGQKLFIEPNQNQKINWKSYDENEDIWFEDNFLVSDILSGDFASKNEISQRLIEILRGVHILNSTFFKSKKGFNIKTTQDFNRSWGLGTSSTLINNIANWANVDAYKLLELTFGGSGYDIACAQHNSAITYQIIEDKPVVNKVNFSPSFSNNIYFVYLNQKQNSRDGIANYRKFKGDLSSYILAINTISERMISCTNLSDFEALIEKHENIISRIINQTPVKEKLFPDFSGAIKSLGAWGGDFVLATSESNPKAYFKSKGFDTILSYSQIIKA